MRFLSFVAAAVLVLATGGVAQSTQVGINFVGTGGSLEPTDSTGVIPQTNFNNVTIANASGTQTLLQALNDSTGGPSGLILESVTQRNSWATYPASSTITDPTAQLLNGYLDGNTSLYPSFTITGLPSTGTYTVYVYGNSDNSFSASPTRVGGITVNGGPAIYFGAVGPGQTSPTFIEATATTAATATLSNYAVFTTSGSTLTVTNIEATGGFNTGITGAQIEIVPEPGSAATALGLGVVGLLGLRRRCQPAA